MKKIFYYSLLMVLVILTGCRNEDELFSQKIDGNYQVNAQLESRADSRTAVNEANQVLWLESDKIGVYGDKGSSNVAFSIGQISDEGASATFVGDLKEGEVATTVYYPYDETATLSGNQLTFTLPAEYDYTENSNAPMIGVKQENGNYLFKHLCGLLKFSFENIPDNATELLITSFGESAPCIAGECIIENVEDNEAVFVLNDEQSQSVTINIKDISGQSNCKFYVPLPVGYYSCIDVKLKDKDRKEIISKSLSDFSIERAMILNVLDDEFVTVDGYSFKKGLEDMTEAILTKDSLLLTYQNNDEWDGIKCLYFAYLTNAAELKDGYAFFNKDGLPETLVTGDFRMEFKNYTSTSFDVCVGLLDGTVLFYEQLLLDHSISVNTRAWNHNWVRTVCYGLSYAVSAINVGLETVKMFAHIYAGPLSTAVGLYSLSSALEEFNEAAERMDDSVNSNYVIEESDENILDIENANLSDVVLAHIGGEIIDEILAKTPSLSINDLILAIDKKYGETYLDIYDEFSKIESFPQVSIDARTVSTSMNSATITVTKDGMWQSGDKCGIAYQAVTIGALDQEMLYKEVECDASNSYDITLSGLSPNTEYIYYPYYKFAETRVIKAGNTQYFETTAMEDGHPHMIDLGLPSGTKWACCNMGSSVPEDLGEQYAIWEEISKLSSDDEEWGEIWTGDGFEISETRYDIARNLWGDNWRLPTYDDWKELLDECEWECFETEEIAGIKVIGPNKNYILLPGITTIIEMYGIRTVTFEGEYCSSSWGEWEDFSGAAVLSFLGTGSNGYTPGQFVVNWASGSDSHSYYVRPVSDK